MRLRRWFEGSLDDALIASAQQEGRLAVIGMPRDWCAYGALIDSFEAKYGLTVTDLKPDASSAGQLRAIKANRDDGTLPAPDVIDVGMSFGPTAKQQGLFQPYKASPWS